jgi:pimeloyl-ACP methyl ester carboxylesterase
MGDACRQVPRWACFVLLATSAACTTAPASERRSETLTLLSKDAQLAATLHLPEGTGPFPAAVLVHGSGRVDGARMVSSHGYSLLSMGVAVLAYDKRGVGRSTGEYTGIGPGNSERMFDLLATDALAGVDALAARRDIDPARIGILGVSQAGWIAPLAASRSPRVAFAILLSGPAVTVGEEIAYSRLAGEDPGSRPGLKDAEIAREFAAFKGPHGFDPAASIAAMPAPSLWILGERDRSLPVAETIANLERIKQTNKRSITVHVVKGANHGLRKATGEEPNFWPVVEEWLRHHGITKKGA